MSAEPTAKKIRTTESNRSAGSEIVEGNCQNASISAQRQVFVTRGPLEMHVPVQVRTSQSFACAKVRRGPPPERMLTEETSGHANERPMNEAHVSCTLV